MVSPRSNRARLFADVISIDAWHTGFAGEQGIAQLHADAVFGDGHLGAEAEARVRFKLRLRRAEVTIVTPHSEPISVVKSSVSRDNPAANGLIKNVVSMASSGGFQLSGDLALAPARVAAHFGAEAASCSSEAHRLDLETEQSFSEIRTVQSQDKDGHYRWILTPGVGLTSLSGRPWDPNREPRLSLRDTRKDKSHLEPSVRVEVRCRKEDLDIYDIEVKDEPVAHRIKRKVGFDNRRAAAEAYIRMVLAEEGLCAEHFDDNFGIVTLADIVVREDLVQ